MRTLSLALTLLTTAAAASGTIVNSEPEAPGPIKAQPSPRVRLLEIDSEILSLQRSTSFQEVFERKMGTMGPLIALGAAPLVGALWGYKPIADTGLGHLANGLLLGTAALFTAVVALCAVVSTLAVFDHWMQEAAAAPAREDRIRTLRTERQQLSLSRI
jgi:hypothetical protein